MMKNVIKFKLILENQRKLINKIGYLIKMNNIRLLEKINECKVEFN